MRIAIVSDAGEPQVNGVVNTLRATQQCLRNKGHEVLMLAPRDFRATLAALPPGGEVALQAPIAAGPLPVSGYTVEVFYP